MKIRFALAGLLLSSLAPLHAQVNPPGQADTSLLSAAHHAEAAVIDTLKDLVSIESGSADAAGLARMADYTAARLQALGAKVERLQPAKGHGPMVKAVFEGTGSKRLMLIAHMDTIYPVGILAREPFRRDGNKLYGPGIADDKGGIAVILHGMQLLKDAGWRDYARVTVLLNGDEEIGSIGSGDTIAALAAEHDLVLSLEPTAAKAVAKHEGVLLGASGVASVTMEVQGRSAHAGAAPDNGRNALVELAHQMLATRDVAQGVPGTQLNWTKASAGTVTNQIPERAVATADVRLKVPDGAQKLTKALEEKVASSQLVPDTRTTVTMSVGRPPYVATPAARELAKQAQRIYAELNGRELALHPMTGGGTDAGFASRSGKAMVLESFGLPGWGYHARNEYVEVDSIAPRLYLLTRLMMTVAPRP